MKHVKGVGKADEGLPHFGNPLILEDLWLNVKLFLLSSKLAPGKGMTCVFQIFGGSSNF